MSGRIVALRIARPPVIFSWEKLAIIHSRSFASCEKPHTLICGEGTYYPNFPLMKKRLMCAALILPALLMMNAGSVSAVTIDNDDIGGDIGKNGGGETIAFESLKRQIIGEINSLLDLRKEARHRATSGNPLTRAKLPRTLTKMDRKMAHLEAHVVLFSPHNSNVWMQPVRQQYVIFRGAALLSQASHKDRYVNNAAGKFDTALAALKKNVVDTEDILESRKDGQSPTVPAAITPPKSSVIVPPRILPQIPPKVPPESPEALPAPLVATVSSKASDAGELFAGEMAFVTGSNFLASNTVTIGQTSVKASSPNGANLNFTVPSSMVEGVYSLSVSNANGVSNQKRVSVRRAQASSVPATPSAAGTLKGVTGDGIIQGWAADPSDPSKTVTVGIYFDGPVGSGWRFGEVAARDTSPSSDVSGNHGFNLKVAPKVRDGAQHTVYVYAVQVGATRITPVLLSGSPQSFALSPVAAAHPDGELLKQLASSLLAAQALLENLKR